MKTNHTPTPFPIPVEMLSDGKGHYFIDAHVNGRSVTIAEIPKFLLTKGNKSEEITAFIVKAVNCHDELVKDLDWAIARIIAGLDAKSNEDSCIKKCREILAKAKGEA